MKALVLHVKHVYFAAMQDGSKPEEFRLCTDYWRKRLENNPYSHILIYDGYPKRGDTGKQLLVPYHGYTVRTINHEHFGADAVQVYAIKIVLP